MAVGRRRVAVAALAVAVLLAHSAAIDWLAEQWQPSVLSNARPLPKPMYTRQITPQAPVAAPKPASNVPPAPVPPARPAITTIAKHGSSATPAAAHAKRDKTATAPVGSTAPSPSTQPAARESAPSRSDDDAAALDNDAAASAAAGSAVVAKPDADADSHARAEPAPAPQPAPDAAHDDPAAGWPNDTRLSYELGGYYLGELHGSAQLLWQHDGDDYEAVLDIDLGLLAHLRLTSRGRITARGLAPRFYEELQRTRRRALRFDDAAIVLNDGRRVERPAQVQDIASQFVELAHGFRTGRLPLEPGATLGLWLARPGGVGWWRYDVVRSELLPTPGLGAVDAYHLKPQPLAQPGGGSYSAEIWFAPGLQYLPVKIRVSLDRDAWVELIVTRIDQR